MKPVLRYSFITRSGRAVTDADRKCFVTTASCAGATKQPDKMCFWSTAGTPEPPGQAPPDTLFLLVKSPPPYDISAAPGGLANASQPYSKLRARSPLFVRFSVAFEDSAGF